MKTQRINVFFDSATKQVSIEQETITLTDSIDGVLWRFHGLPKGASPVIGFADDQGPFVSLETGAKSVMGKGNIGPGPVDLYSYQVEVRTRRGLAHTTTGLLINAATAGTVSFPLHGPAQCEWPATCGGV
jgi:hypothetical protein